MDFRLSIHLFFLYVLRKLVPLFVQSAFLAKFIDFLLIWRKSMFLIGAAARAAVTFSVACALDFLARPLEPDPSIIVTGSFIITPPNPTLPRQHH